MQSPQPAFAGRRTVSGEELPLTTEACAARRHVRATGRQVGARAGTRGPRDAAEAALSGPMREYPPRAGPACGSEVQESAWQGTAAHVAAETVPWWRSEALTHNASAPRVPQVRSKGPGAARAMPGPLDSDRRSPGPTAPGMPSSAGRLIPVSAAGQGRKTPSACGTGHRRPRQALTWLITQSRVPSKRKEGASGHDARTKGTDGAPPQPGPPPSPAAARDLPGRRNGKWPSLLLKASSLGMRHRTCPPRRQSRPKS